MKKLYSFPQTINVVFMPDSHVMLLGSPTGPEPTAPERQASGGDFLPL